MRVIAGSARRLLLKTPAGYVTRPTSDKVKETLFNILMPYIYSDTVFLDLFSGSGGIGIEALSRGALKTVFVENNKEAVACIKENLKTTRFSEASSVMNSDALTALHKLEGQEIFDIIFMDPPYNKGYERSILEYLAHSGMVNNETLIVVEASNETDFDYVAELGYKVVKFKKYKNNCHLFLNIKEKETK
ncbi:MAG: 16S rRNA (guanine(966)-N(2))-methyltransferase RsmD [Lachnospiraceae bacterium]|nr:16S rRNA (guanine(966)-N(2))-methyltransferase RsmD [Lachnospiraceae bacterium]